MTSPRRPRRFTNSPAVLSSIRSPYGPFEASGHLNVSHTHAHTDDSDEDDKYWRDQAGSENCYNRFLVKWSVKTKAVITPAALSDGGRFGPPDAAACELHVFAKARVLCRSRHLGPHTNTARFGGGGAPRTPRSIHTRSRAHALFLSTSTDPPPRPRAATPSASAARCLHSAARRRRGHCDQLDPAARDEEPGQRRARGALHPCQGIAS
jgi:hypothetical protein